MGPSLDDLRWYGVLRPHLGESLGFKAVDHDTARLLQALAEPAPLPEYVAYEADSESRREILRLIADRVIEVDLGAGFVSGADALALYGSPARVCAGGHIAKLSRKALQYAHALPIDASEDLARRIYLYNSLPLTPGRRRLLHSQEGHAKYLGLGAEGPAARVLSRDWSALTSSSDWLAWGNLTQMTLSSRCPFKLYVSPVLEALCADGFASVVSALSTTRAAQFKVGADAAGLLRPDKLVAYFADFEALAEGASLVYERLAGMPAHGVPFSAEFRGGGLLSWGVDPPRTDGSSWSIGDSWRVWLVRLLARAIIDARRSPQAWRFAMERVLLEGVDPNTWTPELSIFQEA